MTATPTTSPASPSRRHRWFQFSLRTLFIVTLACSIPLAWVTAERRKNAKGLADMKALKELGVSIDFASSKPPRSKWRQMVFGDESHLDVVVVACYFDAKVTDAGLEHLQGLTNLKDLNLHGMTQVTDAGLEHLQGLTKLEWLGLNGTQVTDAGLEHLKRLTNLKRLTLEGTQVTDAGLEHLKCLTKLEELTLYNTQVTDAGLEHLKRLTNLKGLRLDDTKITDAGLEHLQGLTNLEWMWLYDTQVTHAGVASLEKALPNCRIERFR